MIYHFKYKFIDTAKQILKSEDSNVSSRFRLYCLLQSGNLIGGVWFPRAMLTQIYGDDKIGRKKHSYKMIDGIPLCVQ